MGQYPWGFTGVTPNASDNLPDTASTTARTSSSPTTARCPARPTHHYAALVGVRPHDRRPARSGADHCGPQPGHRCTGTEPGADAQSTATTARSAGAPAAS